MAAIDNATSYGTPQHEANTTAQNTTNSQFRGGPKGRRPLHPRYDGSYAGNPYGGMGYNAAAGEPSGYSKGRRPMAPTPASYAAAAQQNANQMAGAPGTPLAAQNQLHPNQGVPNSSNQYGVPLQDQATQAAENVGTVPAGVTPSGVMPGLGTGTAATTPAATATTPAATTTPAPTVSQSVNGAVIGPVHAKYAGKPIGANGLPEGMDPDSFEASDWNREAKAAGSAAGGGTTTPPPATTTAGGTGPSPNIIAKWANKPVDPKTGFPQGMDPDSFEASDYNAARRAAGLPPLRPPKQQTTQPGGATAAQIAENATPIPGVTQTQVPGGTTTTPPPATGPMGPGGVPYGTPTPNPQNPSQMIIYKDPATMPGGKVSGAVSAPFVDANAEAQRQSAVFTANAPAFGTAAYSQGSPAQKQLWDLAGSLANPMNKGMWNADVLAKLAAKLTPEQRAAALEYAQSLPKSVTGGYAG